MVKDPLAMQQVQEMGVQSLAWEDPGGGNGNPYNSMLAWKVPQSEEPGGLQSMGLQRVRHDSMSASIQNLSVI